MTASMLDIGVIIIIGIFVLMSYKKGLILAGFDLVSWVLSITLSRVLYPYVSTFLRETPLYTIIKGSVADKIDFSEKIGSATQKIQTEAINRLNLPSFIKNALLENNNPEVHKLLNVSSIEDYVAGYVANICINIISVILLIVIVFFLIRFLGVVLNIISMLPVIHSLNRLGGAIVGLFTGVIIVWIIFAAATILISQSKYESFWTALDGSTVAGWLYETNIIIKLISSIR